jgi:hypothetical protein
MLILPYYDNEFVDFFRQMPFSYLLSKKLYVNTIFTEILSDCAVLKNTPRESGPVKLVGNPYWTELWPKILMKLKRNRIRKGLEHKIYYQIPEIKLSMPDDFPMPQYIKLLKENGIPIPYMQSLLGISEVVEKLKQ